MASVSNAAIDRRLSPFRAKYFLRMASCSARVARRQPPAVCSSMKPPTFSSRTRLIFSSCATISSRPTFNYSTRSSSATGSLLTKRIASRAAFSSLASIVINCELRLVDRRVGLGYEYLSEVMALFQRNRAETNELEHAEEDGDQLVAVSSLQAPLQLERRLPLQAAI